MSDPLGDEERAELIGALTNAVLVADGLLEACRPAPPKPWSGSRRPPNSRSLMPASTLSGGVRIWTS